MDNFEQHFFEVVSWAFPEHRGFKASGAAAAQTKIVDRVTDEMKLAGYDEIHVLASGEEQNDVAAITLTGDKSASHKGAACVKIIIHSQPLNTWMVSSVERININEN